MITRARSLTAATVVGLIAVPALGGAVQPRRELATATLTRPDHPHRLIVKFRDAARVRVTDRGLASRAGADLDAVRTVADTRGATFAPLIRLSEARLAFVETRATRASGVAQPDFAGLMIVDAPDGQIAPTAEALDTLAVVEFVAFTELRPAPPCEDAAPATPSYRSLQGYHGPDPGLNMTAAWGLGAARGGGIRIADCEYGYNAGHEDLCDIVMEPGQTIHPGVISNGWDEHGTAVFGEMISLDNDYGCRGLVPEANGHFFTEWSVEEGFRRESAIANAIASVDPGDLVVLEMQTTGNGGGYGPAELNPAVWLLTRTAADSGIIVVGAAGNGNQNLDGAPYQEYRERGDSGAIIVGAGSPDVGHHKLSFSTFGSRVNVQGWGSSVFTLGYGSYVEHAGDKNQRYTAGFNGTSSATPTVASACAALQSLAEDRLGRRLGPLEIRQLLVDTGLPQGNGGHIGPLPDVYAAALVIAEQCPADLDGSGAVDFGDILAILTAWGSCGDGCREDLDGSGAVDFGDILVVLAQWGACEG